MATTTATVDELKNLKRTPPPPDISIASIDGKLCFFWYENTAINKNVNIGQLGGEKVFYVPVEGAGESDDRPEFKLPPSRLVNLFIEKYGKNIEEVDETILAECKTYPTLRSFQQESVRFIIKRGGRAINASEMGTGKTAVAICLSEYYEIKYQKDAKTFTTTFTTTTPPFNQLIVCPASLRSNWRAEFKKFTAADNVHLILNGNVDFKSGRNVISYNLLATPKVAAKALARNWHLIVIDESHYAKNVHANRTKILLKLKSERVVLLSGTPSSRSVELYSQLKIIDPFNFKNFFPFPYWRTIDPEDFYFANRYCDPVKVHIPGRQPKFTFKGNKRSQELHALLAMYMTRTTKEEALRDLPPKTRERIVLEELSEADRQEFKVKLQQLDDMRASGGGERGNSAGKSADFQLMDLVRETCTRKVKYACSFVRDLANEPEDKFLVFGYHRQMIDALEEVLVQKKCKYILIDGRTDVAKRQDLVDRFQNDEEIHFAILGITAAGVGLNLFAANRVVFAELIFGDKDHLQCEDRAHRQGLVRPVLVQYLILEGSTDDIVWYSLAGKIKNTAIVVDGAKRTFSSAYGERFVASDLQHLVTSSDKKAKIDDEVLCGDSKCSE